MSAPALLAAALGTWLGIQSLRFALAMVIWNVAEDNIPLEGEVGIGLWALGIAGMFLVRFLPERRRLAWLTLLFAVLVVLRQVLPGENSSPAFAFAAWIVWLWWIPQLIARLSSGGRLAELGLGAVVGVALEFAGQTALHGLDLELLIGPASVVAAIVVAALLVLAVAAVPRAGVPAAGAWGAFALFPALFIELTLAVSAGRVEVDSGLGPLIVQLAIAAGLVLGLVLAAAPLPRAVRIVLSALAVIALALGQNVGPLLALSVIVVQAGVVVGLVAAFTSGPRRGDGRVTLGVAAGAVVLFALVFVFYSYRDRTDWLWPIAGALVVAPGLMARAVTTAWSPRPALAAAAAIVAALAVAALPPPPTLSSAPSPSDQITVLDYNQHQGFDYWSVPSAPALADRIDSAGADIVALEEVNRGWDLSAGIDHFAYLRWRLPQYHAAYGRMDTALFGNAIFSRYPIRESGYGILPHLNSALMRGYVWATIDTPKGTVLFVATHFTAYEGFDVERERQADAYAEFWAKRPRAILAGDYNAHPDDLTITKLIGSGLVDAGAKAGIANEFTYSSGAPHERIDYVFVSPDVTPVSARILDGTASDHRPVVVVVRLP